MDTTEKIIRCEDIYDGKVIKVKKFEVMLPDGNKSIREEVVHSGGAGILAVKDGFVYFVSQYRLAARGELLEIPAGKLNLGEDPEETARRELIEEVGLRPKKLKRIAAFYVSPGYTNEIIRVYHAEGLEETDRKLDDDEFLNVVRLPVDKAIEMLDRGEFVDSKTIIAMYYLKSIVTSRA